MVNAVDAEYLLLSCGFHGLKVNGQYNCTDCEKAMTCVEFNNRWCNSTFFF